MQSISKNNCQSALRKAYKSLDDLCFRQGHLERHATRQKVISNATQKARYQVMRRVLRDLHTLGFSIEDVGNVRQKHVRSLAKLWEERNLGASQIQKMCSVIRVIGRWQDKDDLIPPYPELFSDPSFYKRTYVAKEDKSWDALGVDPIQILERILVVDEYVAIQVLLTWAFGLRIQEAQRFHPELGDMGDKIRVKWGAKNGRSREVDFFPEYALLQRTVLDLSKRFVNKQTGSTIPPDYTAQQWYSHFVYVVRVHGGVTKKALGATMHGLRHQFLARLYESITGIERPLRMLRQLAPDQKKLDEKARQLVALAAGHARSQISSAYLG